MTATTYRSGRAGNVLRGGLDLLAKAVRLAGAVCAVLLVVNILLTVFHANPGNAITQFFAWASGGLALWFENLFTPDNPTLALVINHGLASVAYLIAAAIVARLLRAV
jgi:hypothetical protein